MRTATTFAAVTVFGHVHSIIFCRSVVKGTFDRTSNNIKLFNFNSTSQMDPLTAIGLASSIVQFVDFGTKLIGGAREIYFSTTGTTEENASLELVTIEIRAWSSKLVYSGSSAQSDEGKAICSLATECQILSDKILELIIKAKPKNPKSEIRVLFAVIRDKWHENEKLQLQKRLGKLQRPAQCATFSSR